MSKPNIIGLKTKQGQLMDILTIDDNKELNIGGVAIKNVVDYTAFEVMPHNVQIASNEISDLVTDPDGNTITCINSLAILACTTHKMTLRSHQEPENCDVVIDWGDGTIEAIKDMTWTTTTHTAGKSYELSHDYSAVVGKDENGQWKKFIVKIYGKNYYTFRHNSYKNNNLISRIFDVDLPIASHIRNFASIAMYAKRLLKVRIPHSCYSNVCNWSTCFANCANLQYVYGFEDNNMWYNDEAVVNGLFQGCSKLIDTDFKFAPGINQIKTTFSNCNALTTNIAKILPENGFSSAAITIQQLFYSCTNITYEDIDGKMTVADRLWNSKTVKWNLTGQYKPFYGTFSGTNSAANKINKNKVPVSWGGTNTSIDAQLAITDEMKNDYTAWEIMCRWETIYGEFADKSYLGDLNEKTGYKYKKSLPYTASTGEGFTEKFILRTTTLQENQDIIVDWGDGTFSNVKNGDFESVSSSGFDYTMSHTYTQPSEFDKEVLDSNTTSKYRKTKKYIIKVYGKQYYGFKYTNIEPYNLMCRCLDWDLPVASHFTNLASFCYGAKGLQVVAVPEYTTYLKNAINFSSMFDGSSPNNCNNLVSVTGFGKNDNDINYACNFMFNNCTNLIECDFILPNLNTGSMASVFNNCNSLNVDINSLIPKQGFLHKEINVENLFNSTAISGNVPANLLWNDSNITWKNTANTFSNCSDEIRAQVPVSWGGTASDDIIIKNQSYDDQQLRQLIANKVEKIDGKGLSTNDFTNEDKTKLANLKNYDDTEIQETLITKADLVDGKVPASQLPSYVDDVIEGTINLENNSMTDLTGKSVVIEKSKIYIDTNTNKQYRWSGSKLTEISSSIALGETSSTAYPGDRGKALEDSIKNKADKSDIKEYSSSETITVESNGEISVSDKVALKTDLPEVITNYNFLIEKPTFKSSTEDLLEVKWHRVDSLLISGAGNDDCNGEWYVVGSTTAPQGTDRQWYRHFNHLKHDGEKWIIVNPGDKVLYFSQESDADPWTLTFYASAEYSPAPTVEKESNRKQEEIDVGLTFSIGNGLEIADGKIGIKGVVHFEEEAEGHFGLYTDENGLHFSGLNFIVQQKDLNQAIGNINKILDAINGEEV